jgi:kinesin family protein 5
MEHKGILPRMMEYVFELIQNSSHDIAFSVKCSYLEIYNEKIQDLLDRIKFLTLARKNNLVVKEEKEKGIWVQDATEIYVATKEEMLEVFQIGSENRKVGSTLMNQNSSRSHSLFIVTIFQQDNLSESTKTGKLYFIDLAGSEKMSKTGAEGQTLEEAKNINKSLLMLGMVINSLCENKPHIPYRDSKLTRILQESLGGNSLTTLIITCSMNAFNDKETLSTLRFGQRAKNIKNKIVINTERSAKELLKKLNDAENKIKNYEEIIEKIGKGGILDGTGTPRSDKCEDCSFAMKKLLNQHIELVTANEELEKTRIEKEDLENEIRQRSNEIYELNEKLLVNEMKTKIFIDEEMKTFGESQIRAEHIFLLNQQKLTETNKIKNLIDRTKAEIIILIKSNRIKLENKEDDAVIDELKRYIKSLEEALEIVNTIEDYIITDNKNLDDLIDLLVNSNNCLKGGSLNVSTTTLTCNKNNNIIKNRKNYKQARQSDRSKSMTFSKTEGFKRNSISSVNVLSLSSENFEPEEQNECLSPINDKVTNVIMNQRKTIIEITTEYHNIKQLLCNIKKESEEKELIFSKSHEDVIRTEYKVKEYENRTKDLEDKLEKQGLEFEEYKTKSMKDFKYKEEKLIQLYDKVSDLEEANYRLIHFNKDKDKKKYFQMEKQIGTLTIELQKLMSDNSKLKDMLNKRDEEMKKLYSRIIDLENRLLNTKMNE